MTDLFLVDLSQPQGFTCLHISVTFDEIHNRKSNKLLFNLSHSSTGVDVLRILHPPAQVFNAEVFGLHLCVVVKKKTPHLCRRERI